jgi:hypothetical protein
MKPLYIYFLAASLACTSCSDSWLDLKEEVKEDSLYTVDEVFDAIFETTKHLQIEIPWDYIDDVKEHLSRKNDPQYLEFLRLKAIYE